MEGCEGRERVRRGKHLPCLLGGLGVSGVGVTIGTGEVMVSCSTTAKGGER